MHDHYRSPMDHDVWAQPRLTRAQHRAWRFVRHHWAMSVVLALGIVIAGVLLPAYPDTWGRLWVAVVGTAIGAVAAVFGVVGWMLISEPFMRLVEIHTLLLQATDDHPSRLRQFLDAEMRTAESLLTQTQAATTAVELEAARQRVIAWAKVLRSALEFHRTGLGNVLLAAAPPLANAGLLSQHELANMVSQIADSLGTVHAVAIAGDSGLPGAAAGRGEPGQSAEGMTPDEHRSGEEGR